MGIIEIIALLAALAEAGKKVATMLTETMALFMKMNKEGRTKLTDDEVKQMLAVDDAARKVLVDRIAKA